MNENTKKRQRHYIRLKELEDGRSLEWLIKVNRQRAEHRQCTVFGLTSFRPSHSCTVQFIAERF